MEQVKYLTTDVLIDGSDEVIKDAVIEIKGSLISNVGNSETVKIPDSADVFHSPVIMPGMWDCHTHMLGGNTTDTLKWMEESATTRAIRSTRSVKNLINAGFTSIRDVGGPFALRLKKAIHEGVIPGPNVYAAHKFLSQTAGHGDSHTTPLTWQSHEFVEWTSHVVDGVDECIKATRTNIREGADLIKIFVTGGVFSHIDLPQHAHFTIDEIRAIITEAKRFDLPTSAHAHGLQGINNAIDAGITTIEHGTYLDEETARKMVEKGVILVPTLQILRVFMDNSAALGLPESILNKAKDNMRIHQENISIAIKAGVEIAAGSDLLGMTEMTEHGHGNAAELLRLEEAGLSKMQALQAATSMGPKTLGPRAPKTGVIKTGCTADLLCLEKNPLEDLSILQIKEHLRMVYKSGVQVSRHGKLIE